MITQQRPRIRDTQPIDPEEEFDATALKFTRAKGAPKRGNDLLVVTTYCQKDNWLMMKRCEWMQHLGVRPTHDMLLVGDSDVADHDLQAMASLYRSVFRTVTIAKLKGQHQGEGWPRGTNAAFRNTVRLVHGLFKFKFDNHSYRGWLYFETDITPLKADFLNQMHEDYIAKRQPYMGVVGEIKTKSGQVIRHMNGAAIYPFGMQFFSDSTMLTENVPWDVAGLTGQSFMKLVNDMGHKRYSMHFSTSGYKKLSEGKYEATKTYVGGDPFQVVCDILDTHLLHHGCKDASLIDLLMGKKVEEKPKVAVPKVEPSQSDSDKVAAIRADYVSGMKWKDLIKKHKLMPKELKAILEG